MAQAMSAPSKEEIASWTADMLADASRCIDIWNRAEASGRSLRGMIRPEGAYVIASLFDENDRLRSHNNACGDKIALLADENERLRAENEIAGAAADMGRNTMTAQSDEIGRLRAERAECIALLEDAKPNEYGEQHAAEWRRKRSALVAKLRGQS